MKKNYAWIICILSTLLVFTTIGMSSNIFPTHLPYFLDEFNVSNSSNSTVNTIRWLFAVIGMSFVDKHYARFDIRLGSAISCFVLAAGFAVCAIAPNIYVIYLGQVIIGISYGIGGLIPATVLIKRWFKDKAAFAMGIAAAGTGIAMIFLVPVQVKLIEGLGLSETFFVEAAIAVLSGVLLIIFVRNYPSEMGLAPYESKIKLSKSAVREAPEKEKHMAAAAALIPKKDRFFLIFTAFLLSGASIVATGHYNLFFDECGIQSGIMATALSVYGFTMMCAKFLSGAVIEKIGIVRVNAITLILITAGSIFLVMTKSGLPIFMFAGLFCISVGMPVSTVGLSVWATNLTLDSDYQKLSKQCQVAFLLGGTAMSSLPGVVADIAGSYLYTYLYAAITSIAALIIIQRIYRRASFGIE